MAPILQTRIPYHVSAGARLPGVQPLDPGAWLLRDEAFAAQMAERDRLLTDHLSDVVAMDPSAEAAARELLDLVLAQVYPGCGPVVRRADGVRVAVDRAAAMRTLGRLVQEDFCILQKYGDEHVLSAAVLCFPASWSLSEKFMRPLIRIHAPVPDYDSGIARRVQRLFDGVRVGQPLWRFNLLRYADPALHQPRVEAAPRDRTAAANRAYLRSERQTILRLPETSAVVFGIHTFVVRACGYLLVLSTLASMLDRLSAARGAAPPAS